MTGTPAQPRLPVPAPPAGRRRKPVNILAVLARRSLFVLAAGALLSALLAPLMMVGARAVYSTSGMLAIDPGKEATLTGRERDTIPGNVGDYTRTLLHRLTSGDVLVDAMKSVPPERWPSFLDRRRPPEANVGRLFKALKTKEVARTYLMSVEISGGEPAGLSTMLNAMLEASVAKLRAELEQQNARRLEYLVAERDSMTNRIAAERRRILDLAAGLPSKAFLHESYTVHLSEVEQIQRLYWEAEALRAQREGDFQRALADWNRLRALSLQAYADERVADNFGINRIEQWTYEQLQSLRSTIDGLTTNNRDRSYVEMRMDAMNEYLRQYKGEVNESTIRILNDKRDHDLATSLVSASNALSGATSASESLGRRLGEARSRAAAVSEAIFDAADISFNITQFRERLTALNSRIDDVQLEMKAPVRVHIDRYAGDPRHPASNTAPLLALLGVALAFGLVAAGVIGFEFLDDRVRGQAEIEAAIGGPAPGPIPELRHGAFERALLDAPGSPTGIAVRALVVRLNRERLQHGAKVFAFSPAGTAAGNTSLALNAAQGLACYTPRVLLLTLGPGGLGARAGVALPDGRALLRDPAALSRAAARDAARGIDLAEADVSHEPLPLKTGLPGLIGAARAAYDAVVLDLGRVPGDDLALSALHHADAAIFTAREDQALYRDLRQAIEAAAAAGIPALTAVLNGTLRPLVSPVPQIIGQLLAHVSRLHRQAIAAARRRLPRCGRAQARP